MITFACPHCAYQIKVTAELAGRRGKCARCGKPITVPSEPATVPARAASGPLDGADYGAAVAWSADVERPHDCGECGRDFPGFAIRGAHADPAGAPGYRQTGPRGAAANDLRPSERRDLLVAHRAWASRPGLAAPRASLGLQDRQSRRLDVRHGNGAARPRWLGSRFCQASHVGAVQFCQL